MKSKHGKLKAAKSNQHPSSHATQRIPAPNVSAEMPVSMDVLVPAIGAIATLTKGVLTFFPDHSELSAPLDIVLAGAGNAEITTKDLMGHADRTGVKKRPHLRLTLVGNDLPTKHQELLEYTSSIGSEEFSRDFHPTLLAHFLQRHPLRRPDLIVMYQPCIAFHRDLWLRDTALRDYVRAGVPVVLSADRPSDVDGDRALLAAAGYQLSDVTDLRPLNPTKTIEAQNGQSSNDEPLFGQFFYTITGIDVDRWAAHDYWGVQSYDAHLFSLKREPDFLLHMRLREKITTGSAYPQRQGEATRFMNMMEAFNNSLYYARRFLAPPESRKLQNDDYAAAFMIASAKQGRIDEMDQFLKKHPAAIHAVDGVGCSALHWAAISNQATAVEFLADAGCDLNQIADTGDTPLAMAARLKCGRTVDALLQKGAQRYVGPQGMPFHHLQDLLNKIEVVQRPVP